MQESWWKDRKDLDEDQERVIVLEPDGNHLLVGPPGCGKTNLLLLRAKYLSSSGKKNVLFITYGRTLAEFIKTGIGPKQLIDPANVMTFRWWAKKILGDFAPAVLRNEPDQPYDEVRSWYIEQLRQALQSAPKDYYDAIFVDEVQDITGDELEILGRLTTRLNVAGDQRQSIFNGDGITKAHSLRFNLIRLHYHYRIGLEICKVADKILPPYDGARMLAETSNYPEKKNPSSATCVPCATLGEQLDNLIAALRTQLKAFVGESIGIFVPSYKNGVLDEIQSRLDASEFASLVSYHTPDARTFPDGKRVFVMTCHSAKGTEFRAVHIITAERFSGNLAKRTLVFTAVTRAKTSLRMYHAGRIQSFIESAFAEEKVGDIDAIF
ncbi:ATP-binding domain-containing protein [Massilia sp. NP310]|uniref:ATP-binding domain-containing protein n=1 Tax=Massilia sp. NP310 TaxID=2861282 RepID=UPI001C636D8E|nr:ATP-binding domain-containing protein [Massilia sp. NP310]QYG02511.1 ATP-binding domain-containing protein [Massilia sp. NP310]